MHTILRSMPAATTLSLSLFGSLMMDQFGAALGVRRRPMTEGIIMEILLEWPRTH